MAINGSTIIIADDLTGACDTSLQYFKAGSSVKIVVDLDEDFSKFENTDVISFSTESRNIAKEEASKRIIKITSKFQNELTKDKFFKKIDSTLRGNVGVEIVSMLNILQKDAAIIAPAYIEENRTTVGGYQLLNGIPIERTQCALDPKAPIFESFIPDIIKKDINEKFSDLISVIDFKTVTKGAGPITLKINELIQKGKKILVLDAVSTTDLEQIALAVKKSNYDILPCASAGLANAFNKLTDSEIHLNKEIDIPNLPRLIISGSATQLAFNQIQKLEENSKNAYFINLNIEEIITNNQNIINKISEKLLEGADVVVYVSKIDYNSFDEETKNLLIDSGVAKNELPSRITDYLSNLVYEINFKNNFILILIGGETSYKCASKINSKYLDIMDVILPAVPLCKDANSKIIVTKSGNFGTSGTLVEIIDYFNRLKNV